MRVFPGFEEVVDSFVLDSSMMIGMDTYLVLRGREEDL